MIGVYIHIPFCKSICSYCDFCKIIYNKKYVEKYLDELEREIKKRYTGEVVKTIYIGGGTPSALDVWELKRLFSILKIFKLDRDNEYTIEANIENIEIEKVELFKDNGVNRISLGVESFSEDIQKILGRKHNEEMIFNNIDLVKKYFKNINIDLIYGVVDDTSKFKMDIEKFLKLDIPHLSCYSLILEENTKLYIDKYKYIDEDIDYEMFNYANKILNSHKYSHYEISNYAKEGYESIHNKNYWLNGEYYGFGLGAVSYINNHRISNTKNMTKYLDGNYIESDIFEDIDVRKENDLILGLRLIEGISVDVFNQKYNDNLLEKDIIKELIMDGYLEVFSGNIRCNYKYIYLLNNILERIMGCDL